MVKVSATFELEKSLWKTNKKFVVGIDEVGRGAWAGPLVAAAVIFPKNYQSKVDFFDSKMISASTREKLARLVRREAVCFGIGEVGVEEIIDWGLTAATQEAYKRAVKNLSCIPDHFLIDAFYIKSLPKRNQTAVIHGDSISATIAAASIVAKVYRDNLMESLAKIYQHYKFAFNKGYGTEDHQEAIRQHGLSAAHRTNYDLKFLYE